jgi:hypothetical protein
VAQGESQLLMQKKKKKGQIRKANLKPGQT